MGAALLCCLITKTEAIDSFDLIGHIGVTFSRL